MHIGCVVLACKSGGPLESIGFGQTGGKLLPPDEIAWADMLKELFKYTPETRENNLIAEEQWQPEIKKLGKARVQALFTEKSFTQGLLAALDGMESKKNR
jgi:glycosyltransferase involved in cell wall biosynthesis